MDQFKGHLSVFLLRRSKAFHIDWEKCTYILHCTIIIFINFCSSFVLKEMYKDGKAAASIVSLIMYIISCILK